MLRRRYHTEDKAQIMLEYSIVIGAVILIMFAMGTMIKRGSQGMIKVVADQVGNQINAEQRFDDSGHLEASYTSTRSSSTKKTDEFNAITTYSFDEQTATNGTTVTNLGYTNFN